MRLWGRHAVEAALKNPMRHHRKLWATREGLDSLDGELPPDFPLEFADGADLARLVGSMDSIANLAAGAADRISMRRFSLPEEMNAQLVAMAQVDVEAVKMLRGAVVAMSSDLREAIKLAGKVDRIESRADELFAEIYRGMFEMDTDFKTFHQLKAIIERLESIADRCNQNAELIRHMALEYLDRQ